MRTHIGKLRHRGTLQTPTRTQSGDGYTESWAVLAVGNAAIETATARAVERVFGGKVQSPIGSLITMRDQDAFTPTALEKVRGIFKGRTFHVKGWQKVEERGRWLVLACEELP